MSRRSVRPSSSGAEVQPAPAPRAPPAPSCATFPAARRRASFATSASGSPSLAATAAATAPPPAAPRKEHRLALLRRQEIERGLGAEDGAPEIHQHEHAVAGHRRGSIASITRTASVPSARLRRARRRARFATSGPAISARQFAYALGQRAAVRDDHDPDHGSGRRAEPVGAVESSTGWTACMPEACSICQRQVSLSQAARSPFDSRSSPKSRCRPSSRSRTSPS